MANWSIPERKIKIELYAGRTKERDTRLLSTLDMSYKIEFDITQAVTDAVKSATITIGGLKTEIMHYLATSYIWFDKKPIFNTIILYAGYKNGGNYGKIFEGSIIEAVPNLDTANYSINITANSWYKEMVSSNKITSISKSGEKSVNEILKELAQLYHLKLQSSLPDDVVITDFSTDDKNLIETLRILSAQADIDLIAEDGRIYAKKRGRAVDMKPFIIDDTNMIGCPKPHPHGCDVNIRLNPSIVSGQPVLLRSTRFPQLNSLNYFIQTFGHGGDTKGNKWQTSLKLVRDNIYGEKDE